MSSIDNIVTIKLDFTKPGYRVKYLVGLDQKAFAESIHSLGVEFLDSSHIHAILFDRTPLDTIKTDMLDYKLVLDEFPNYDRLMTKAIYIGNYAEKDHLDIVEQMLSEMSHPHKYSIEYIAS